MAMFK